MELSQQIAQDCIALKIKDLELRSFNWTDIMHTNSRPNLSFPLQSVVLLWDQTKVQQLSAVEYGEFLE